MSCFVTSFQVIYHDMSFHYLSLPVKSSHVLSHDSHLILYATLCQFLSLSVVMTWLHHNILYHNMSCPSFIVMSWYNLSLSVTLFHVTSYFVTSCHIFSCHVTICHVLSLSVTSYNILSHHVTTCHIISHLVTSSHLMISFLVKLCNMYHQGLWEGVTPINFRRGPGPGGPRSS
jgi:hypothetical protein